MFTRTIVLFTFGVAAVLVGAAQTDAQPGKGKGKGGPDIEKLERDLRQLLEQVEEAKGALARAKEAGQPKGDKGKKGGFGGFPYGKGKGFDGKKGFEGKGKKGFEGKGEKLDRETITERYNYYKKLYDELPKESKKGKGFEGKGKGKFGPGKGFEGKKGPMPEPPSTSRSVEGRIDALIRELEELRREVRGKKK